MHFQDFKLTVQTDQFFLLLGVSTRWPQGGNNVDARTLKVSVLPLEVHQIQLNSGPIPSSQKGADPHRKMGPRFFVIEGSA